MTGAASESRSLWAPGKVFLAGEYAVLERGRPALVAAVDRGLRLTSRPLGEPVVVLRHAPSGESLTGDLSANAAAPVTFRGGVPGGLRFAARAVWFSLRLCAEEGLPPRGFSATFEDDLSAPGKGGTLRKLGLGGSAAASVLAVRATALSQGRALAPVETLAVALAAHWVEQGGSGSGGDVAASSLGGLSLVRVRHLWRTPEQVLGLPARSLLVDGPLEVQPVPVPADLRLLLAFSGVSADTRALVGEVRAFAQARPARWREHTERISRRAEQLAALLEDTARDGGLAPRESTLEVLRRAAAAMAALGDEAGVPIATPALQQICALASSAGGAAKPSGAGGGDCAVALAFGDPAVAAVEQRLSGAAVACFRVGVAKRFDPGPEPLALPAVGAS